MDTIKELILHSLDKCEQFISWILYKIAVMFPSQVKRIVTDQLEFSGVVINGVEPKHMKVRNDKFYPKVLAYGTLGLMEAYLDEWWDCEELDMLVSDILRKGSLYKNNSHHSIFFLNFKLKWFNMQSRYKATEVINQHYDLRMDLFETFLDPSMNYSCGYWKNATDLNQAQINRMELTAKKLILKAGMKILNIGMGYGGIDKYLCEQYGVSVVGYTLSSEMAKEAKKRCKGLNVTIFCKDYRDVTGKFDRIISCEMFEHVGPHNYKTYFEIANKCLVDDGIFLLQTGVVNGGKGIFQSNPGFDKLILKNLYVPRLEQIIEATNDLFIVEDLHNFGFDHYYTLKAFDENFVKNWHLISENYGGKFYRLWRFFLLFSAGSFHARYAQLHQIVFTKTGLHGGYMSVR